MATTSSLLAGHRSRFGMYVLGWLLIGLLWLSGAAGATTPVRAGEPGLLEPSHSLAEALNPDGTLKAGIVGSFDPAGFRMGTAPDGRPVFRPAGPTGAGDADWQSGFALPGADWPVYAVASSGTDV